MVIGNEFLHNYGNNVTIREAWLNCQEVEIVFYVPNFFVPCE